MNGPAFYRWLARWAFYLGIVAVVVLAVQANRLQRPAGGVSGGRRDFINKLGVWPPAGGVPGGAAKGEQAVQTAELVFSIGLGALAGGLVAGIVGFVAGEHRRLRDLGPLPFLAYARAPRKLRRVFLSIQPSASEPGKPEVVVVAKVVPNAGAPKTAAKGTSSPRRHVRDVPPQA